MTELKIAYNNIFKHRWSSLIMAVLFVCATYLVYWIFGFGNAINSVLIDLLRYSYKDITFNVEFTPREKISKLLAPYDTHETILGKKAWCMMDHPKESGMVTVYEIRESNLEELKEKIKMEEGRFPDKPEEIMVTRNFLSGKLKLGDSVYATTVTPQKILNTLQYTIVGINDDYDVMITEKSMNLLLNSGEYTNFISLSLREEMSPREEVEKLYTELDRLLKANGVEIKKSTHIYEELDKQSVGFPILMGVKIISIGVITVLIGAVLGALVWVYSFKRRKELWTYSALGFADRRIIRIIAMEYWLIAFFSVSTGLVLGAITSTITENGDIWLKFSRTFNIPLVTKMGVADIFIIFAFLFLGIFVWVQKPVKKVIKDRPFSY